MWIPDIQNFMSLKTKNSGATYYFLKTHKSFWNKTKKGINSRRPASISVINISFVDAVKSAKLPKGPIICPKPGPILPTAATDPTTAIIVFFSKIAIKNADNTINAK